MTRTTYVDVVGDVDDGCWAELAVPGAIAAMLVAAAMTPMVAFRIRLDIALSLSAVPSGWGLGLRAVNKMFMFRAMVCC
jgi:hypothetical protein